MGPGGLHCHCNWGGRLWITWWGDARDGSKGKIIPIEQIPEKLAGNAWKVVLLQRKTHPVGSRLPLGREIYCSIEQFGGDQGRVQSMHRQCFWTISEAGKADSV